MKGRIFAIEEIKTAFAARVKPYQKVLIRTVSRIGKSVGASVLHLRGII